MWWEADDTTELAVLYLESFGRPRRFARTARRVAAKVPVLTVHAGRSAPGQRAAASHTAAAGSPLITRQALFEQAGIIATAGFGELLQQTRDRLREVLPPGSSLDGPVDTTDAVSAAAFLDALHLAAAQDGVHAVLALVVRRGPADLIPVLTAERWPVPVAAVVLGQPEAIRLLPGAGPDGGAVPAYAYPEAAARALARAARYGSWRSRPAGTVPELAGLCVADAQAGEVRAAMYRLQAAFAGRTSGVLVEPMVTGGVETIVGVVQEPVFGPVVVFGLGGVATDVLGDHAARLAPLTDADADDLIHSIRAAPSLLGRPGRPAVDVGAVRDTLLRVSRLADDLPQVAELDLNPVIARPDGVVAVDARIRVTSHRLADPFLRQLP